MSRLENRSYHEARAEAETLLAEQAKEPAIAGVHRELAAMHRRMLMDIVGQAARPAEAEPHRAALGH